MTAPTRRPRSSIRPTRPPGGGQARAERTRAAIMDETIRCVIEEGFAAASAKHITERAGVTWGVIQYHFGDRDGLLAAVVDSGFDALRAHMATLEIVGGTTRERVTALVEAAWAAFSTPTSRASLEILIATRGHRNQSTEQHLAAMAGELSRLGRQVVPDPHSANDPGSVGDLLWATLRGLIVAQMVVVDAVDTTQARAALTEVLVAYLETDTRPSRPSRPSRSKGTTRA